MLKRWKPTVVEWGLVALLAVLCTILSGLQYRWTGEVSRVEAERLRAGINLWAQQFCRAFDLALTESCKTLVPHDETLNDGNREAVHIQHFERWKPIRPRPYFSRLAVAVPTTNGIQLFEQSQNDGNLTPLAWPDEWKSLRENLGRVNHQVTSPAENPMGTLFEFPVYDGPRGESVPSTEGVASIVRGPGGESEWMIFELDTNYICNFLLPELVEVYLNPADQPLYDIVVKTVLPPNRVIFSSRPEVLKSTEALVVVQLNRGGRAPEDNPGAGPDFWWRLEVHPRPGALEAVVAASHRRNLAVALLLNGLIFAAGFALVRHTRTSRRLAEAQMNFVANVSHELRTPLTVIRGAAHNLGRGVVHERAQIEQYSNLITQHAEQLGEMVEQVLALAGARRRDITTTSQPVALADVLKDAVAATTHDTQAAKCKVHLDLPAVLPVIPGDASALRRVFQNLITNAAKHGGDGKWIGITAVDDAAGQPPMVEVRVADRGPGIPLDEQDEIFKPFYRTAQAQAAQIRGSGLGLSLVKEIVVAHGGTVSVESANGQGATFRVRLPKEKPKKTK